MGVALARMLLESGVRVKLLDKDRDRCREVAEMLPGALVLCGDGTRQETLNSENLSQMDAVVATTNMDEENVFICMYANMAGVPQAIPKVNRTEYVTVCQNCGIKSIISPKDICAQEIVHYVRAMQSTSADSILSVYRLMDGKVETLEFEVTDDVPHLGEKLTDVRLKPNMLIACITRHGKVIFPGGSDSLQKGDVVVELREIFES